MSFRVSAEQKLLIENNARVKGMNISEYLIDTLSLSLVDDDFFILSKESDSGDQDGTKSQTVTARFSQSDYKALLLRAQKARMSLSKYIKATTLNPEHEIVIYDGLKEFNYSLSKIGNNLNQLTTLAHQGKITVADLSDVNGLLKDVWTMLDELSKQKKRKRK